MYFPDQPIDWDLLLDKFISLLYLHVSHSLQLLKKGCSFWSCAACQCVWRILPLKFGVTISQT